MMRRAEWRDSVGRRWITLIPEDQPDEMASMGIPVGPLSLAPLGLPLDFEVRLHNELVARDLIDEPSVRRRSQEVIAAIRSTIKASAHDIIRLYEQEAAAEADA
jgi:hypothetical protein